MYRVGSVQSTKLWEERRAARCTMTPQTHAQTHTHTHTHIPACCCRVGHVHLQELCALGFKLQGQVHDLLLPLGDQRVAPGVPSPLLSSGEQRGGSARRRLMHAIQECTGKQALCATLITATRYASHNTRKKGTSRHSTRG
jgi:hypothetical protein